jgi:A/G-specific adenine glycosylase
VIIAEKLLQQTAAKEVTVRAYRELVTRFPDFDALAEARLADLKAIILPLGFSYRADELRSLARAVIHRHDGAIPSNLNQLLALPGVGDYIARAVLSFAFLADVPVVDTNVARFLYRLYGLEKKLPTNPARDRQLIEMATVLVPVGQSRNFNLAILDLCASICLPGIPLCERCILRKECVVGRARTGAGDQSGSGQRELFPIQHASR